jgi:hypothetical protein
MSSSEDVKTLFRRFGGEPDTYQEVVRERQTLQSLNKWTMLGQVELNHPQAIPSARRAVKGSAVRHLLEETYQEVTEVPAVIAVLAPSPIAARGFSAPPSSSIEPVQPALKPAVVQTTPPRAAWVAIPRSPSQATPTVHANTETAPEPIQVSVSAITPRTSPLAARLKAPIEAPAIEVVKAQSNSHSLVGLFGRLSKPQLPPPSVGVLRRKFTK